MQYELQKRYLVDLNWFISCTSTDRWKRPGAERRDIVNSDGTQSHSDAYCDGDSDSDGDGDGRDGDCDDVVVFIFAFVFALVFVFIFVFAFVFVFVGDEFDVEGMGEGSWGESCESRERACVDPYLN